jgi:hypothetical protein
MAGFINASLRTRIAGSWFRMISRCRWWMIGFADHALSSIFAHLFWVLGFGSWYFIWHGCPQVARIPTRKALLSAPQVVVCSRKVCGDNHGECRNHHKLRECKQMIITRVRRCYCLHLHHGTLNSCTCDASGPWPSVRKSLNGKLLEASTKTSRRSRYQRGCVPGQKPNDTEWFKLQIAQKILPKWRQIIGAEQELLSGFCGSCTFSQGVVQLL